MISLRPTENNDPNLESGGAGYLVGRNWQELSNPGDWGSASAYQVATDDAKFGFVLAASYVCGRAFGKLPGIRGPGVSIAGPKPPGYDAATWDYRTSSRITSNDKSYWDPQGGEWQLHKPDPWHSEPHWNYNPWNSWNSAWQNRPL